MAKRSTRRAVLAAMEAQAFVERDTQKLIETGVAQIPPD